MKKQMGNMLAGSLTAFLLVAQVLFGQEEPQLPKIGVQVNLVSLDAEVLDRKGNLVQGLGASDFVVEENGKRMEISNFALSTGRPTSVAAVLDTSALTAKQLSICKQFLLIFAHKLDHGDELCLYSFDERNAYLEQAWTTNRPLLMGALDNIGVPSKRPPGILIELFGAEPRTGLAIDRALLQLKEARQPEKGSAAYFQPIQGTGTGDGRARAAIRLHLDNAGIPPQSDPARFAGRR